MFIGVNAMIRAPAFDLPMRAVIIGGNGVGAVCTGRLHWRQSAGRR